MGCTMSASDKHELNRLLSYPNRKFKQYYVLGQKVGYGAFAQVRLCLHRQTGQQRVVKIITKPYSIEDFELEILLLRFVANGASENVVDFIEYFADKRFFYSVMEYCRGGDLFTHVANCQRLTEAKLANWMKQILKGLEHIHSQGVVHRDIKPQNLLFADDSHQILKITDFGLGFQMRQGELLDEPCGTPEFLAPEMILGRYGRKVDIWAVGVLCYIFLFGKRPFSSPTDPELYCAIVEAEPNYRPSEKSSYVPSTAAVSFCQALLQKNSRIRPTATEALKHPWIQAASTNLYDKRIRKSESIKPTIVIPTTIRRLAKAETLAIGQQRALPRHNDANSLNTSDVERSDDTDDDTEDVKETQQPVYVGKSEAEVVGTAITHKYPLNPQPPVISENYSNCPNQCITPPPPPPLPSTSTDVIDHSILSKKKNLNHVTRINVNQYRSMTSDIGFLRDENKNTRRFSSSNPRLVEHERIFTKSITTIKESPYDGSTTNTIIASSESGNPKHLSV